MKLFGEIFTSILLGLLFTVCAAQPSRPGILEKMQTWESNAEKYLLQNNFDSLKVVSEKMIEYAAATKTYYGQAVAYNLLSEILFKNLKMEESEKYNNLLYELAQKQKDTFFLISGLNRKGLYLIEKGKHKEADMYLQQALLLSKNSSPVTADINSNLGSLHLALGDKEQALQYFQKASFLFEVHKNQKGIGESYSNISSIYYLMGNIDEAIANQLKSISIREAIDDKGGLSIANINIGQLYLLKENNEQSLKHLKNAIKYAEEIQNPKLKAASYAAMGVFNIKTKNLATATEWQAKAIKIYEEIQDNQMLSRMYVSAGSVAVLGTDSLLTLNYFTKALNLSQQLSNKENIANAYDKLSHFYTTRKDYEKAYGYYKKYILYKDSISAKSNLAKIEEIKTKYETEKKDNEINRLNILQKLNQLEIEKQNAELAGNILLAKKKEAEIDLLSKNALVLAQKSELQSLKLDQQNIELEKQKIQQQYNQQQLAIKENEKLKKDKELSNQKTIRNLLLGSLVMLILLGLSYISRYKLTKKLEQQKALLAIRNNISKDLHDEIGSTLTSITILSTASENAVGKSSSHTKEMLHEIARQSKTIQQNMSDIVWSIHSENDSIDNLATRIREYIGLTLEPLQIDTAINIDETLTQLKLPIHYRKELLLICKEAINNIAKHSGATSASIQINKNNNQLLLSIMDNGSWKGNNSGTGTKSMKGRAVAMGGELSITQHPNATTIQLVAPIP